MNRMAEVVDPPGVGVVPLAWNPHRSAVVAPEVATQLAAGFLLKGHARAMLDQEQFERVGERAEDVGAFAIVRGRQRWLKDLLRPRGGCRRRENAENKTDNRRASHPDKSSNTQDYNAGPGALKSQIERHAVIRFEQPRLH